MKRMTTTIIAMLCLTLTANAQQSLPYSTGFDNASEKAGWQHFRKGGTGSLDWNYASEFALYTPASPPDCIQHTYNTSGGTSVTEDWFVSPALDLSSGGKLELKINVYAIIGSVAPDDNIEVYLLSGSADPSSATLTLLDSFNDLVSTNYDWQDVSDISIPLTAENTYIAFRYTNLDNWFTVAVDDIKIDYSTAGIEETTIGNNGFKLYPNPAVTTIFWEYGPYFSPNALEKGAVLDVTGKVLGSFPAHQEKQDVSSLSPGIYFLKIGKTTKSFIKK